MESIHKSHVIGLLLGVLCMYICGILIIIFITRTPSDVIYPVDYEIYYNVTKTANGTICQIEQP